MDVDAPRYSNLPTHSAELEILQIQREHDAEVKRLTAAGNYSGLDAECFKYQAACAAFNAKHGLT